MHDKLRFLDWGRRVKELDEPVEERGGQGFPAFSLGSLVLNSYEPEVGMFGDGGVEFWKEDLASVIENGVQALQDGLAGQIQVVYHQPLPLFQTVHQHSVLPFKLHAFSFPVITLVRHVAPQQVHDVCLRAKSHLLHHVIAQITQLHHKSLLPALLLSFDQNCFV